MGNDDAFIMVSDDKGQDCYCPLGAIDRENRLMADTGDDCIETEVVHRYSGNIRVVRS